MKKDMKMMHKDSKSLLGEAYRTIRTNIQFSGVEKVLKSLIITSSVAEEGKTTTAINLAYSISQSDKKVMLVDSDLRRPTIHKVFDLPNESGLTTILAEDMDYNKYIQSINGENVDILTSGPIPPNPSELLGTKRMQQLLDKMKEDYDMVILDSPPVGIVTDAAVLSTIADGTILICASGVTDINAIKAAKAALDKVNANIIGVIINKAPMNRREYYYY